MGAAGPAGPISASRYVPAVARQVLRSPGRPLEPRTRAALEPWVGVDLAHVRVHTDAPAAHSAAVLGARAYTVGPDVVWGAGEYAPDTPAGLRLLSHELVHVAQQQRGARAGVGGPSPASEAVATRVAESGAAGATGIGVARIPRTLDGSLDATQLSFTELEDEIREIDEYLGEDPQNSVENDRLLEEQQRFRQELAARRRRQERGGRRRRRRRGVEAAQRPRSLDQTLLVDETLPDAELYAEIDAIHAALEAGVSKKERRQLRAALTDLEAERQRREGVVAEEKRAERVRQAFAPTVTATDGEALVEVMGAVESIRPSTSQPGNYFLVRGGELLVITQEEYDKIRAAALEILRNRLTRVRIKAEGAESIYDSQREVNEDQPIVSGIVHFFGGIDDPGPAVRRNVAQSRVSEFATRQALAAGRLTQAARFFATSETHATIADRLAHAYVNEVISTAETSVTVLEITRDAAFATTLALGAAVAAPVVAAGAAGAGLTGATATAATAVGTAGVVGTGGAVLRGGSAAAGVASAGGSAEEVFAAGVAEGKRGLKEGVATAVGAGVAQGVGAAVKVGQSGSRLVNLGRGAVAQGAGGGAGSATGTALEGGSVGDIARSGVTGFGVGALTGPLSSGAGGIRNPVAGAVARTTVGAGVSGGVEYLGSGDREAAFRAAAVGGASAFLGGRNPTATGPTRGQQRAYGAGRSLRSTAAAGARRARSFALAAGIGLAEGVPATRGSGASIGGISDVRGGRRIRPSSPAEVRPAAQTPPVAEARSAEARPVRAVDEGAGARARPAPEVVHNEIDPALLGAAGPDLELDLRPFQERQSVAPDFGGFTEAEMLANAARVPRRDQFGAPSTERGGTEARAGAHFHEYTQAEVANRLRVDFDPVAGRPRSVSYQVHAAAATSSRQTDRSFAPDVTIEGRQPTHGSFTGTGFERGHLAQRQAGRGDADVERDFDLTTAVVPQTRALNRGPGSPWRASERRTIQLATQYGFVEVRVETIYDTVPPRLPDGTPVPRAFRRTVTAPDGTVLEDATHLNQ